MLALAVIELGAGPMTCAAAAVCTGSRKLAIQRSANKPTRRTHPPPYRGNSCRVSMGLR